MLHLLALWLTLAAWAETPAEHTQLGNEHYEEGRYAEAVGEFEEALSLAEESGVAGLELAPLIADLATALTTAGQHGAALELYRRAVSIQTELAPDSPELAADNSNLGVVLYELGQYAEAVTVLREALAIMEHTGAESRQLISPLNGLGAAHTAFGDHRQASVSFERALRLAEGLEPGSTELTTTLINAANARSHLGDNLGAILLLERAMAFEDAAPDHPLVANVLGALAREYQYTGRYAEARPLLERALDIADAAFEGPHPSVANAINNLAALLADQGDFEAAHAGYERALAMYEEALGPDHPAVGAALGNLALVYVRQGDSESALDLFARALEISEKAGEGPLRIAHQLNNVSGPLEKLGHYDEAIDVLERSLQIYEAEAGVDHIRVAMVCGNLARVHGHLGEYERAVELLQRAVRIQDAAMPFHPAAMTFHGSLSAALSHVGEADASRAHLVEASTRAEQAMDSLLPFLSGREALSFMASQRKVFDQVLIGFNQPEEAPHAWETTLRWKGAIARAHTARTQAARTDPEHAPRVEVLNSTRAELAKLVLSGGEATQIEALRVEQERQERQLAESSELARRESTSRDAGSTEICAALSDGATLVDFVLHIGRNEAHYLAFVVDDSCAVQRVDLGAAPPIDQAVESYRNAMQSAAESLLGTERIDDRGAVLYDLIWEPIAPFVSSDRVVLAPDGALTAIPFAALPTADRYLVEDLHISYVEAATDLLPMPEPSGRGSLLVGGVPYDGILAPCSDAALPDLPGTMDEVQAIQRRLGKRATVLSGSAATEAAVTAAMGGVDVIHLATHGFFAGECAVPEGTPPPDPMVRSGLALTPGSGDGLLTAAEVSAIDLSATRLVVLSACNTGLGEIHRGQGVLGLRRAFAASGARNFIMSLWSISDSATAMLMPTMYRSLKRQGASGALRDAQLAAIRQNRKAYNDARPWEWGAFIVSGRP